MSLESLTLNEIRSQDANNQILSTKKSATDGMNRASSSLPQTVKKSVSFTPETKETSTGGSGAADVEDDWRAQMKKIIARNLQTRDAYADKHEVLAAKPRRHNQQTKLRRPEEPVRRALPTVEQSRTPSVGNPRSIGQFYCARSKPTRSRGRHQVARGRRSNIMRVQDIDQRRSRHPPMRSYAPPSPRRSAAMNSRFPCILSEDVDPTTAPERDVNYDLKSLSAMCADSVLSG